jgi:ArsR family transcriptional regulator, arsenate/arsenite/antimonite-responsive transcriptional repressor
MFVYIQHATPMALSLDDFIRIAKALADARRFSILERIAATGDAACQHLCEQFPVSQPTMSHHLRLLVDAGLIEMRRDGQYVHYRLRAETVRAYTATLESRLGTGWARVERNTRRKGVGPPTG